MRRPRHAYTDHDSYHALDQAVRWLAQMRGITHPPPAPIDPADLLHLLASLILHARTCMAAALEELHDSDDDIDPEDLEHILAGPHPD